MQMFTFCGLIQPKISGFSFVAGRDLASLDVEQVGTVESLQAGVCEKPLG